MCLILASRVLPLPGEPVEDTQRGVCGPVGVGVARGELGHAHALPERRVAVLTEKTAQKNIPYLYNLIYNKVQRSMGILVLCLLTQYLSNTNKAHVPKT